MKSHKEDNSELVPFYLLNSLALLVKMKHGKWCNKDHIGLEFA